MSVKVSVSREMQEGFPQSKATAAENLLDLVTVEMQKLEPIDTSELVQGTQRVGSGQNSEIVSNRPYAIRRNYENYLHPGTKFFIERSAMNVARGDSSRWWKADPSVNDIGPTTFFK